MKAFSQYICSIILTGLCAFLCEYIASHFSKSNGMSGALKLITGLCVFTVAVSPIFSLIGKHMSFRYDTSQDTSDTVTEQDFITLTEKELEKALTTKILQETGINIEDISIEIEYDDNNITVKQIAATVSSEKDIQTVKNCISNYFGKDSRTKISVKTNEEY